MSSITRRQYKEPRWPDEPFFLQAQVPEGVEGWTLGPFTHTDWGTGPDGEKIYADGLIYPVTLRIIRQDHDVIHANDGPNPMDYKIVKWRDAPPQWRGQDE